MQIKKFFRQFIVLLKKSRRHQIIFGAAGFLLLTALSLLIFYLVQAGPAALNVINKRGEGSRNNEQGKTAEQDYALPSGTRLLDGMTVPEAESNKLPLAIMIENLSVVRPQSGLSRANLVYEALAEGGITRFLAVFSGTEDLPEIGPVRSARVYYLDWAGELAAAYIHCGGDPYALRLIRQYKMKDLDQSYNGYFFWRKNEMAAPHNLFTKTSLLNEAASAKGWIDQGNFKPWLFKTEATLDSRPDAVADLSIDFSAPSYAVVWKYDRENNQYLRYNGGFSHLDKNNNEQIAAKNVIVQFMFAALKDDDLAKGRLGMHTIGGDKALIFRDGEVVSGIWKKNYREDRTRFYTEDWKEIEFNPGQIWIEVVPMERAVSY
ncbi:MAG: DUF3048 domain-containing protein [bacterium]|nr:DUF3048 domain-containing protein [bacterium]